MSPLILSVVDDEFRDDYTTQSQEEGHGLSEDPQQRSKLEKKRIHISTSNRLPFLTVLVVIGYFFSEVICTHKVHCGSSNQFA